MNKEILHKEGSTISLANGTYEDITITLRSNNSFNFTICVGGALTNIQVNLYYVHFSIVIRIAETVDTEQYQLVQIQHLPKGSYKMRLVNKSGGVAQVLHYCYQFTQS